MDALKEANVEENTFVFFTSDNGLASFPGLPLSLVVSHFTFFYGERLQMREKGRLIIGDIIHACIPPIKLWLSKETILVYYNSEK